MPFSFCRDFCGRTVIVIQATARRRRLYTARGIGSMTESTDTPEGVGTGWRPDRRAAMKAALGGAVAAAAMTAPRITNFTVVPSYAAAYSGSATGNLTKATVGSAGYPSNFCTVGTATNVARGSASFVRSGTPATICVTITLSTGTSITGRSVTIFQSNASGCLGSTVVGTWAAAPAAGPQTFCAAVLAGATKFFVNLDISGGTGNQAWASTVVTLP